MSLELSATDIESLSIDAVYNRLIRMESTAESLGNGLDFSRGVLRDLVLRPNSIFLQATSDHVDNIAASVNPLLAFVSDSTEPDVIDQMASFYGLSRYQAVAATGTIRVEISTDRSIVIARGTTFTTESGVSFTTPQVFAVRSSLSEVQTSSDRQLTQLNNGNYEFTLDAVAVNAGTSSHVPAGTKLTPSNASIPELIEAEALTAFDGGQNQETSQSLVQRLRRAYPAKSLSTRASIASFLSQPETIPELEAVSTVGFGDEEMLRARSGIPAADIYLRTTPLPTTLLVTKTATAVSVTEGGAATWQVSIERDDAPGFYAIRSVRLSDGRQLQISNTELGYDDSPIPGEAIPRIMNVVDAAFSRFQTATVQAVGSSLDVNEGDTQSAVVEVLYMPKIALAQTHVSSRAFRFVGGDTLVKAAIPTFVSVGITIHARPGSELPAASLVRDAVADFFNTAGFPSAMHLTRVATLVNGMLPESASVSSVEAVLNTVLPDGTIDRTRTTGQVHPPSRLDLGVSGRTTTFFCEPSSVIVTPYQENVSVIA